MSDNQQMIEQANRIIKDGKRRCAKGMSKNFPGVQLNPEWLMKGSYSNMAAMVYRLCADHRAERGKEKDEQATSWVTRMLLAFSVDTDWCFGGDKELHGFCKNIFEPAIRYAEHVVFNGDCPEPRGYKILPNGSKFNNGLPASLQYIAPSIMELNAVSKNPDAHQIGDILRDVYRLGTNNSALVAIKMVPELPNAAMIWATQHGIKVY